MTRDWIGGWLAALAGVLAFAAPLVLGLAPALAQAQSALPQIKQIRLNEQHIKGFLGGQKDLTAITAKLDAAGGRIDAKLQAELDGIGRKNGFKDFAAFDEVRWNIMLVLAGINPATGQYADPLDLIKKDIEAVKADKVLSEADRKQLLAEMTEALKQIPPLQFKENIEVVKKHAKAIDEVWK